MMTYFSKDDKRCILNIYFYIIKLIHMLNVTAHQNDMFKYLYSYLMLYTIIIVIYHYILLFTILMSSRI